MTWQLAFRRAGIGTARLPLRLASGNDGQLLLWEGPSGRA